MKETFCISNSSQTSLLPYLSFKYLQFQLICHLILPTLTLFFLHFKLSFCKSFIIFSNYTPSVHFSFYTISLLPFLSCSFDPSPTKSSMAITGGPLYKYFYILYRAIDPSPQHIIEQECQQHHNPSVTHCIVICQKNHQGPSTNNANALLFLLG